MTNVLRLGDRVVVKNRYWLELSGPDTQVTGEVVELRPNHVVVEIPTGAGRKKREGFKYMDVRIAT
jgi:hypothetical protein